MQTIEVKDLTEFAKKVKQASFAAPVVVLFWATWCGPCKSLKPKLGSLQAKYGFQLVGVNAGEFKQVAVDNMVRSVPTVMVYNQGVEVTRFAGDKTEDDLKIALMKVGAFRGSLL